MKIGLAYDLKEAVTASAAGPDDALEEYDSAETVNLLAAAIRSAGHEAVALGGGSAFLKRILETDIDFVFNIAEGRGAYRSREAQVPSVLEMLGIPYSGADPQTLAVALDKPLTKRILQTAGVATPRWQVFAAPADIAAADWGLFTFPVFAKPAFEGSSKGIRFSAVADTPEQAAREIVRLLESYRQPILVEEFIDGDEVTCGIIGNPAAGDAEVLVWPLRVVPRQKSGPFIYSLEVKRNYRNLVDYEFPAALPEPVLAKIKQQALTVFQNLGCRDFSRVDFRVSADGTPWFLEVNPLPGLSLDSDLYIVAVALGWSHERLIQSVLGAALARYPELCVSP
ncbi:MAG: D-alanine--D-alanine ligase [Dehalogenimonas sp.]|uniref:D-alanine--D-alanine ligase n=1 Tax=Candidatus Dehalogenimonas loeffleri TaxID=3127115 RepID=A0ABZ2J7Q4_9CHLR|nr:D-alanine--D-alanine ligase [Dehalogenimonas sp.]